MNSVNCLIPEDEALKDIVEALSKGEIDFADVNIALEDLGVEVNETDADDLLLDYTHHIPHLDLHASHRSKRSLADDSHFATPIEFMDLHLGGIENKASTTINEDVIFSNSFNLEVGSVKQTMIYVDNVLYAIRNGALVQLTCPKCTMVIPDSESGWKVTKTVVISTSPNLAYVVQATARNKVEGTETYTMSIFVACKVNLIDAENIEATHIVELQADMTLTPFSIAQSYPRVSMVETGDDGVLVASFHKRLGNVAGPHLTYVNPQLKETHISNSFLTNTEITDGIVDIKLVRVHQKEEFMLVVANDRAVFIFNIGQSAAGFDVSLVQKWHISNVIEIDWNSDSIGTFLTILQSNGNMETRLLDTDKFFVKMQDFSYDIGLDSWRSVETSQDKDLPSQDLVVFKDTVKGIKFVRHVMPGMYEELEEPFGLTEYVTANPDYETIDLARSVINDEYEYFWLVKPTETKVDYIKININPIPFTINQLNDVTICLQDMEHTLILDKQIAADIHEFDTLIPLTFNVTDLDLDISYITVSGSADITDITINMQSSSSLTYDEIDYTNTASSLSEGHLLVNHEVQSDSHIFANTLFKNGPHNSEARVDSIKSESVQINNGVFKTLSTTNLGGKKVDDIVNNLLTLNGNQNIASKFEFNKIQVSGETQIGTAAVADTSDSGAALIIPEDFVDLSQTNTLAFNLNLNEVVFNAGSSQIFESTINAMDVSSIITTSEMQASTLETPITINGVKNFTNDITADLTEVNSIGSKTKQDLWNFVDRVLYTNESRVLSLNSLQFGNIIVTVGATINQLNDLDVSNTVLNNLVMDKDNNPITINDNTVFQNKIEIDNLTTTYLNSVAPENYLYEGNDQTIEANLNFATLAIPHLKNTARVNNWDLTTAARIDINQVLDTKVNFTADIIVDTGINSASGITIGETDFSEVGKILHVYNDVTISNSIGLKKDDVAVDKVTINGNSFNFKLAELQDRYLMTDIEQTLPLLTDIQQDVSINNFEVGATLDGIQLSNVLTVSGEQTASTTNLLFTGTSKFYRDIIIKGGDLAAINEVKIKDLRDDIFCDKSDDSSNTVESTGNLTITDSDTIVVKSFFDLKVLENLKVFDGNAYKSYGAFNTEVVDLKKTNTFNQKIKFNDVTISGVLNSNVDIVGNNTATINNKNLAQFEETIVKKSVLTNVLTPVEVKSLAGVGQIKTGSIFDGNHLDAHYDQYIILDKNSEQTITAKLSSVNTMTFNNLNVVPQANDDSYFNNKNLVDYDNTLMKSTNVVGSKHLKGSLTVGGNLDVNSVSNSNYLFGVDLKNIADTAVYLSKNQNITAHITANDITAETVFSHEVNGIELNSMCFKDESCVLKENSDVKFSGASLSFPTEMAVDGMLNGDTFVNRKLHLTERSIDSITNLESASKLVFTINSDSTSSLTHLLSDAVRKSSSGQVITSATFNNAVKVSNNFDITSNTINSNGANEVNFAAIVEDAAFLNKENVFTADRIQVGDISVGAVDLSVSELKNTAFINDVDLSNYLDTILVKSTNSSLVQTVVGEVTLSSGLAITGTASIASKLDGIQVGDYVMKDSGDAAKTIFGITFNDTVSVEGAVNSTSASFKADLDNFFNTVVYANKEGTQTLSKNLNFLNNVTFNTLQVVTVNDITADDFVLLNADSPQTIRQAFSQENSTIAKDLTTTTINDIDLKAVELEILLKDREETIIIPAKVTFTEDVILPNNKITIQEFPTIIQDFITILENFSSSLMTYYMDYIAKPLSATIEEIYVANRVGSKRVKYLDQILFEPSWFSNHFDSSNYILGIDAIQQGQDKYFVKLEGGIIGEDCSLADGCVCKNTSISYQSSDASFQQDFTDRAFTFTLDSISLTATSSYDASESCPSEESGELHVKAVELNKVDLQVHMEGTTAESLGNVYGSQIIPGVYSVLDMDLIQFGSGHLLAITTGYANGDDTGLLVYSMTGGAITLIKNVTSSVPIKSLKTLTFRKEKDDKDLEVVHVLASLNNTGVTVYEWIYDTEATIITTDGELLQTIPTTSFSAMDVFKSQPGPEAQENVYITVAYETVINFMNFTVMDMLEYNMVNELYVYSPVIHKHKCRRDNPVTKIQAKQISDYVSIALSCNGVIEIYDFIVNVGIQKVSDYIVHGNLVDWTWFTERLPKTKSIEDLTTLLFIVKEMGGVQRTETLRIGTSGKLTLPQLLYKPDELGY
jgi:hypothetical protein